MVGPGTGIAPFRAFLQERLNSNTNTKNWLFFGERNKNSDFFYGDYFSDLEKQGKLKLSLAFSRDQEEKIYVQHKMIEESKEIWNWLESGAYFYVCGDAEKMAKDVENALLQIAKQEGNLTDEEARQYLKSLRSQKRYRTDVY
jgi:sulfite reductase (NADPH) flavoprotein alpha-component